VTGRAAVGVGVGVGATGRLRRADDDDDRATVSLELVLGLGVLVLPVALLVAVFPGWAERTAMAHVAAQEAARVAVLADEPSGGQAAGVAMARQVAANYGVPAADVSTTVAVPRDALGDLQRGGEVVATVAVVIRLPAMPLTGGARAFTWTVSHAVRVDDYRSLP
jgi:hypothetical protein